MTAGHERPRTYKTEAVVLRQTAAGDADRVLSLYTLQFGALHAVGRGLRRPNSRLAGHLEPLTHVALQLARGRVRDVVTGADTLHGHPALRGSLEGIARGLVCAELVEAFAPDEQPNPDLFAVLIEALALLNDGDGDRLVWHFAFHVLRLTGYMPELQQCVACGAPVQPEQHLFSPGLGGVVCPACARSGAPGGPHEPAGAPVLPLSVTALKTLRYFRDHTCAEGRALRVDSDLALELQRVAGGYIRYLLEREVRSVAFLTHLPRMLPPR